MVKVSKSFSQNFFTLHPNMATTWPAVYLSVLACSWTDHHPCVSSRLIEIHAVPMPSLTNAMIECDRVGLMELVNCIWDLYIAFVHLIYIYSADQVNG